MSRRWPNNPTWRLVAGELKTVADRGWRRYGEIVFGVESGQLRSFIDREHTDAEAEAEYIERRLADMHRAEIARLTKELVAAQSAAAAFDAIRLRRVVDRHRARFAEYQDEVDAMIAESYEVLQSQHQFQQEVA